MKPINKKEPGWGEHAESERMRRKKGLLNNMYRCSPTDGWWFGPLGRPDYRWRT